MKKFVIGLIIAVVLFGSVALLQSQNIGTDLLWKVSNQGTWLFPMVVVAALIDSINPCAFSVLLLTLAFLFSIGKLRAKMVAIGSSYIIGIFLAYVGIGLGLLQALHLFNTPHFVGRVASILLIVLGLINLINEAWPSFPIKLRIPAGVHRPMARLMEKGSVPTAFALGALVGLCEFPCTGGPYLLVLGLLHDQTTYLKGIGYLLFYNLLFILPLVVIVWLASNGALLEKVQAWQNKERKSMRLISGLAMVGLGALIFLL